MSKWGNGYNDFVNNCELSDYEAISLSNNSANPTEMQYDGFLTAYTSQSGSVDFKIYINGVEISDSRPQGGTGYASVAFIKGDKIYYTVSGAGISGQRARFYKKRDYSNR